MLNSWAEVEYFAAPERQRVWGENGKHYEPGILSGCVLFCGRCQKCKGRIASESVYTPSGYSHQFRCASCGKRYFPPIPEHQRPDKEEKKFAPMQYPRNRHPVYNLPPRESLLLPFYKGIYSFLSHIHERNGLNFIGRKVADSYIVTRLDDPDKEPPHETHSIGPNGEFRAYTVE